MFFLLFLRIKKKVKCWTWECVLERSYFVLKATLRLRPKSLILQCDAISNLNLGGNNIWQLRRTLKFAAKVLKLLWDVFHLFWGHCQVASWQKIKIWNDIWLQIGIKWKIMSALLQGNAMTIAFCQLGWSEHLGHRHLSNIDCLMAHTACLVCFSSTVNGRSKKRKMPWKMWHCSGHNKT
jgi:hypothetical protein